MTYRVRTEDEILRAMRSGAAGEGAEASWCQEAALLIHEMQNELDQQHEARRIMYGLLENLRPEIAADCMIRHMRGKDPDAAAAARKMAQYFRETNDAIGSLLDRPADDYDARMRERKP